MTVHTCRFKGHVRTSPTGLNKHGVSVLVARCDCGKLRAKYPESLTYWETRWLERFNSKMETKHHG